MTCALIPSLVGTDEERPLLALELLVCVTAQGLTRANALVPHL